MNLSGKKYLITGATSGIGKNAAEYLIKSCGANVVLVARGKDALEAMNRQYPERCSFFVQDLRDTQQIASLFAQMREQKIRLDGLVHCAGISPLMKVDENDIDTMTDTYRINVFSLIEMVHQMLKTECGNPGASVVAMSSIAAQYASWRQTVYAGSKAAVEETVRCMAKELLNHGMRANCIAAGAVETEMLHHLEQQSPALQEKLEKLYPMGIIAPDRISEMIAYLLSDNARNITGSVLRMDSGFAVAK